MYEAIKPLNTQALETESSSQPVAYQLTSTLERQKAVNASLKSNLLTLTNTVIEGMFHRQAQRSKEVIENIKAEWDAIQKWDSIRRS